MTEDVIGYVIRYVMIRHDSRELLSNDASLQRYNVLRIEYSDVN